MSDSNPIELFRELLARAAPHEPEEGTAMNLATVSATGRPSSRVVLLKGLEDDGFVFYTNYASPKADDLETVPFAALCFYWPSIERQVRIEGPVEKVSADTSDAYFATRPRESQIGAWASRQSDPLDTDEELNRRVAEFEERFSGGPVQRPPFWGGYRLRPERIEFWRSRPGRLHERTLFERSDDSWTRTSLYP